MSMRQRRQKDSSKKLPLSIQSQLVKTLNESHRESLDAIAQSYSDRKEISGTRIIDLDCNGFAMVWKYKDESDIIHDEEMVFAFRNSASTADEVMRAVAVLAHEARLNLRGPKKGDTESSSPSTFKVIDFSFEWPSFRLGTFLLSLLVINAYCGTERVHAGSALKAFLYTYFTPQTCRHIMYFAWALHVTEALIALVICLIIHRAAPAQMPKSLVCKWTSGVLLFGIGCLHPLWKKVTRQFKELDK